MDRRTFLGSVKAAEAIEETWRRSAFVREAGRFQWGQG